MDKIKVLLFFTHYPLALARYFENALRLIESVELKTVGVYTGAWIPWQGGINLPMKYAKPPDVSLPFKPDTQMVDYEMVSAALKDWKPDLVISADPMMVWRNKPTGVKSIHIGTDPHVIDYEHARKVADVFFNMQNYYMQKGDIYLPYAYDHTVHYDVGVQDKEYDVSMIGLQYENRVRLTETLRSRGVKVLFENDRIFDEYRESNNHAKIGVCWSSREDLIARAFEIPMMGQGLVMNFVPDIALPRHKYFQDGAKVFNKLDEAVENIMWYLDNPEAIKSDNERMKAQMRDETYLSRVEQILAEVGYA
jgi:hypothetical protein